MKKMVIAGILAFVLAVVGAVGWVATGFAQTGQLLPVARLVRSGAPGRFGANLLERGPLQPYMLNALAKSLNLTPQQLRTRVSNGETPVQIAQSQGLNQNQIQQLLLNAENQALAQAVKDGVLTQAQADRMKQSMQWMESGRFPGFGMPGFERRFNP